MDKMTEDDVFNLRIGDVIYDKNNKEVEVLDICEYTLKLKIIGSLGFKRQIYEVPEVIARTYTLHKKEYSDG